MDRDRLAALQADDSSRLARQGNQTHGPSHEAAVAGVLCQGGDAQVQRVQGAIVLHHHQALGHPDHAQHPRAPWHCQGRQGLSGVPARRPP